jgi:hypothetical protein
MNVVDPEVTTVSESDPTGEGLKVPVRFIEKPGPQLGMAPSRPFELLACDMRLHLRESDAVVDDPFFAERFVD